MLQNPKVALVYDWVTTPHGGAEKVLLALHEAFPEAPLYTSVADLSQAPWANVFPLKTSFMQHMPRATKWYRWLSWLMPLAFESFDLSDFEIIISVTSAEAKGVITKPSQLHISYILTPTRYLYSHEAEYTNQMPALIRPLIKLGLKYLTWWDQAAAARPDILVPISNVVANRITKYYQRQPAAAIYPPLFERHAVSRNLPANLPQQFVVVISRLVPYKRIELAIEACEELNLHLVIIGDGPAKKSLQQAVTKLSLITFLGPQTDEVTQTILNHSQGLLMPGIEDFGITALEAVASRVPVLIHKESGVAELLENHRDAVFLGQLNRKAVVAALKELLTLEVNSKVATQKIQKYATTTFVENFRNLVLAEWRKTVKKGLHE